MRCWLPVLLAFLGSHILAAQDFLVRGYITDRESGESLIGATVVSENRGAVSGDFGYYSLSLPEGEHILSFSFVGCRDTVVSVNLRRDTFLNVSLERGEMLSESYVSAHTGTGFRSTLTGAETLSAAELLHTPVTLGEPDILKSIQSLPGVQTGAAGSATLFVRGGGPDENLYLLDGVQMYNVSHMLGVFSAFSPDAVKKVDFYKGAFPAEFGGRTASVLDIHTNEGNVENLHGVLSLGMLNSRFHLEGPINRSSTSFSVSGRALHTLFARQFLNREEYQTWFSFYDINARIVHRISDGDRLSLSFYRGYDDFSYIGNETIRKIGDEDYRSHETLDLAWGNTAGALKWNHVFSGGISGSFIAGGCSYAMISDFSRTDIDRSLESTVTETITRSNLTDGFLSADFTVQPSLNQTLHLGASGIMHSCLPNTKTLGSEGRKTEDKRLFSGKEVSIYAEDDFYLPWKMSIRAGMRITAFYSGKILLSPEPRISVRQEFRKGFALKASYARLSQFVHLLSSSQISLPTDLWVPSTMKIPPIFANQITVGGYYDGLTGWEFSMEAYLKTMQNVLEYRDGVSYSRTTEGWESMVETGIGKACGLEILIGKHSGRFTGSLGYTLSDALRRFPGGGVNNGEWFHAKYARRHQAVLQTDYAFSSRVKLNASWRLSSGTRMSLPQGTALYPSTSSSKERMILDYIPCRNNYVLPPSHSLDVNVVVMFPHKRGNSTLTLGVTNLYNAHNPDLVYCTVRSRTEDPNQPYSVVKTFDLNTVTYLPILPAINYSRSF